jgi:predicted DNA-binding transcriptional regulator AlpA
MTTAETGQQTPKLVSVAEACGQLGIGKVKFYELMNAGEFGETVSLPSPTGARPGRRIKQAGIDAFIERNSAQS